MDEMTQRLETACGRLVRGLCVLLVLGAAGFATMAIIKGLVYLAALPITEW